MRKITTFLATCLLTVSLASAQQTMSITNGSFEQWTTTQGHSIMYGTITLYSPYITPTNWHTMKYAIDTTVPIAGRIQTDVPLQIMDRDTLTDGTFGAMLQTFRLTDILTGVSSLGMTLGDNDTVVMPTILSLGQLQTEPTMELMAMLPLLMSDPNAIRMLDTLDFNNYSTGGMDLNGFRVGKLTGKYKYEPADEHATDMGGVILIGTYNNTTTGKRQIIGGGFNTNLTHTHTYTDFEVDYMPLVDDPTLVPDKLEVMFLSSAGTTILQGSKLYIDQVQLVEADDESIETATTEPSINIYPNPSKGKVFAELDAPANIRIFNQLGQTVAQRTGCTGKVSFNLPTAGLYVMEVSNSTFRSVKQVVVTK